MVVVHLDVDVCESMGANTVNTVAEGISSRLVGMMTNEWENSMIWKTMDSILWIWIISLDWFLNLIFFSRF
jgi:hypothetical protein